MLMMMMMMSTGWAIYTPSRGVTGVSKSKKVQNNSFKSILFVAMNFQRWIV